MIFNRLTNYTHKRSSRAILSVFFLWNIFISVNTIAQGLSVSSCPTIDKRSNGNGQASSAAGTFPTYFTNPVAANVSGTSYQTVNFDPTTKTGNINFYWDSSIPVVNLPVITRVWVTASGATSGTLSAIKFGPPPPPTVVGQRYYASYCFYVQNMPPAGKVTLEFTDPQTSIPAFRCTFDLQNNNTTTEPSITCSPTILTQPANRSLCGATSTTFSVVAEGATSYQWQVSTDNVTFSNISNGANYANVTTSTLTINSPNNFDGKYYRVIVGSAGCTSTTSSSALLVAKPSPTAVFEGASNVCGTGTRSMQVNLTGTGPWSITYSSTPSGGSPSSSTVTANTSPFFFSVAPSGITTYAITSVSDRYCSNNTPSGNTTVTVNTSPTITPTNPTACLNSSSFNLTYSTTGSPNKYSLSTGTRVMPGFTAISNASLTGSGMAITIPSSGVSAGVYDFNLTVTNTTTGCVSAVVPITLTIVSPPVMSVTSSTTNFCAGSSVTLTASPAGLASYTWTASSGATPNAVINPSVTVNTTTTYTVTGTNANGCTSTATITLVPTAGPTLAISPSAPTICLGSATTLTATGGSTYSWTPSTGLSATTGSSVIASPTTTTTYTVTSQNETGCQSIGTVTVTVSEASVSVSPSAPTICAGSSQLLTASGASTYTWYNSAGTVLSTSAAYTPTPSATTTYYVRGVTAAGCVAVSSVTVTISPAPVNSGTSTSQNLVFCTQGVSSFPLTVNTTENTTMTWGYSTTAGGPFTTFASAITPTGANVSAPTTSATSSSVTISNYGNSGYGGPKFFRCTIVGATCTYFYDITITDTKAAAVGTAPAPTATRTTVCSGENSTLTIGSLQSGVTVLWSKSTTSATTGFTDILTATSSSYTTDPLTQTTWYKVTYSPSNCGSSTIATQITVAAALTSNTVTASQSCTDGSTSITIDGTAITGASYQWQISTTSISTGFSNIIGATSEDYVLPTNILSQTTWYRRVASSSNCGANTSTGVVVYSPISNNQISNSPSSFCNTATAISLTGTTPVGGSGTFTYQWQISSTSATAGFADISGANSINYTTLSQTSNRWYRRIVTTSGGCTSTSSSFKITVNTAPTVSVTSTQNICSGTSVILTASNSAQSKRMSYAWTPTSDLSSSTGASVIASPSINTTYTVTGTDSNGCTSSAQVVVNVTSSPSAPTLTQSTKSICSGSSFNLATVQPGGVTVEWYSVPEVNVTYKLASTTVSTAGTYYAFAKNGSCYSASASTLVLSVVDVSAPTPTATSLTLCTVSADITALQPNAASGTVLEWHTGNTSGSSIVADATAVSSGTYYLFAKSTVEGCYGPASTAVTVTLNSLINPTLSASTASICSPNTLDLNTYNTTSGGTSYLWYTVSSNPSAASLVAIPNQISSSGTYYLYATNASGCVGPASSGITVTINPKPSSDISSPASACGGASRTITATTDANSPTYIWELSTNSGSSWNTISNAGVYSGATTASLAISNTTGLGGNYYRFTTTSSASCSTTSNAAILVEEATPSIATQPIDASTSSGTAVTFSVSISGSPTADFQWKVSTDNGANYTNLSDNSTYSGSNSSTLVLTNPSLGMNGYKYKCDVSNSCTTVNSTAATLTVSALNPGSIAASQHICSGSTPNAFTSASAASGGTGTITYQWQSSTTSSVSGFSDIAGATNATYTSGALTQVTYFKRNASTTTDGIVSSNVVSVTIDPASVGGTVGGGTTVCTGTNSTVLTLTGHTGSVTKWQMSTSSDFTTGVTDTAVTATTITIANLTSTKYYRAVVTSGACASANSAVATITVDPASVGGDAKIGTATSTSVCTGTNSTTITLSGHTGTVTKWQSSTDNFATAPTDIANTTTSLTATNLTSTTYYRAVVTSGACASANSAVATITVDPASVGGDAKIGTATSTSVCTGTNSTTITLSGHTGTVTKWQSSTDNFATAPTDISNTTTTLTATNLTTTTYYRAVVTSGACASANSAVATVTVDPASVGGDAKIGTATSANVCTGTNSTTITLSGHTGTVTKWQSATNAGFTGTVTDISNTTTTLSATNLTTTTYYRAVVTSGACASANSAVATITVDPASVGGDAKIGTATSTSVCTGTNSTTITLSGHTGTVTKWQSSTDNFATAPTDISNTTTTLSATNLTTTTYYRAVVTSGACASANSAVATITVDPASVGGDAKIGTATSTSVCTGTNSTTITLSGHTGTVTKWQSSTDNFATAPTDIANTTTSLTATNLTSTTYYRAVVTSGACASANSAVATVTVDPASVGGDAKIGTATSANVCTGTNSTTITLSGHTGTVTKWQSATNAGFTGTVTDISNTTTTLSATNLTTTTYYRAVVTSGACASANSAVATVTVDPASVGGDAKIGTATSANVCTGTNSTTITLSGHTGTVTKWQSATNAGFTGTVTDISNTTTTLSATNLTTTTYYRAVVTSGACASANSAVATITVDPASVGGDAKIGTATSTSVCTGTNSTTITLSGHTGTVTKWQSSTDNFATAPTDISNTTTTLSATNLTTTTYYRAVVTSGACASANSAVATITVDPASVGGDAKIGTATSTSVCTGTNSTTITLSGHTGTVTKWQSSTDNFATAPTDISNTTTTLTATNLTTTTYYRAVVTSGACASANSAVATVTVDPASVGGDAKIGTATSANVCTGTNSTTITLSGHTGTVTKWQSATNAGFTGTVTDISNTTTTLSATNLTTTTYYRAVVTSGACASANSAVATVTVDPASVGGDAKIGTATSANVCTGTNSTTITLSGHTGTVTKWQSSTDNFATAPTDIANTTTTLTATNLTTTTYYRAVVTSGICSSANSAVATITVDPASVGGNAKIGTATSTNVCTGTNSTAITLSGHTGTVTKWQSATNAGFTGTVTDIANTTTTLSVTNLTTTTYYRAVVSSGTCSSANSAVATIAVDPVSVGGNAKIGTATSTSVCTGTNSTTITLSGHTGTVTKWQSSTDNFATAPTDIANTTTTLTATNLTTTTYYRAVVTSGICSSANSAVATITVDPASVGGNAKIGTATSTNVCTGTNSTAITLSGHTGTVTKWQSATNAGFTGTVTDIANTTTTLSVTNLTTTTYYRAVVSSGTCSSANSAVATIAVDPVSVGGNAKIGTATSTNVCTGTNSTTITLSGHTGTVTKWQSATNAGFTGTVTDIANTTTSLTATNLTATTYYRAVIASGICSNTSSTIASVFVDPASVGGTVSGGGTVCSGTNSTIITLSGHTGTVTKWQSSTDNFATAPTDIANTTTTLTATNLTSTTYYRAVITSGTCSSANSAVASIVINSTISINSIAKPIVDSFYISGDPATIIGSTPAGGNGTYAFQWQSSTVDSSTNFVNISGATSKDYDPGLLNTTTWFRRKVYSGLCDSTISNTAKVKIQVLYHPPHAIDDTLSVNEDTGPTNGSVANNDTDPENDPLTFTILNNVKNGTLVLNPNGSFVYQPNPNYNGKDTLYYLVCDNSPVVSCDTGMLVINILPVNDPPIVDSDTIRRVTPEGVPIEICIGSNDIDGDPVAISSITGQSLGQTTNSPNADSCFIYTPDPNKNGLDTIIVIVSDGHGGFDTTYVIINITPVNDKPIAIDDFNSTSEDSTINGTVATNDSDPDSDPLSYAIVSNVNHGSIIFNADGSYTYTPALNYNGKDTLIYKVCDNGSPSLCDTAMLILTIAPINDKPIAVNDYRQLPVNTSLQVDASINDSDVELGVLTYVFANPTHGTINVNSNGVFTYTPNNNYVGKDSLMYTLCDNGIPSLCDTAFVYFDVIGSPNNPPKAQRDEFSMPENYTLQKTVASNDSDPENDILSFSIATAPSHGTVSINANGNFAYTPNTNYVGVDSFKYYVNDNAAPSLADSNWCVITVINTPKPSVGIALSVAEPTAITTEKYQITYTIVVKNYGDVALDNIRIREDLAAVFTSPATFTISNIIMPSGLNLNPNYDGINDTQLLDSTISFLPVGVTRTIKIVLDVLPNLPVSVFNNSVQISADMADTTVYDNSVNGLDPDPNGDSTPNENSITSLSITLFIPSGFSPDGDGTNEQFVIPGLENYPTNKLEIFNRWGNKVFEMSPYDNSWSGGASNTGGLVIGDGVLPNGTYFYVLDFGVNSVTPVTGYIVIKK